MTPDAFLAYVLAALALAVVPGPTVTVILANTLRYGTRAGLMNVAGTLTGATLWLLVATAGLSAMIAVMGVWFDLLRYAGAAYLIWLGIRLFRSRGDLAAATDRARPRGSFYLQGFVVILSNPKVLVLFGAMIPPFLPRQGDPALWTFALGATFIGIAALTDTTYTLLAGRARQWLRQSRIRVIEVVSGCCLTAGGLWMALKR